MPRIRQYAERYAVEDFWKEIDRCCPLAGIQSDNAVALEEKTIRPFGTIGRAKPKCG